MDLGFFVITKKLLHIFRPVLILRANLALAAAYMPSVATGVTGLEHIQIALAG
jgi:hypothetical protein